MRVVCEIMPAFSWMNVFLNSLYATIYNVHCQLISIRGSDWNACLRLGRSGQCIGSSINLSTTARYKSKTLTNPCILYTYIVTNHFLMRVVLKWI